MTPTPRPAFIIAPLLLAALVAVSLVGVGSYAAYRRDRPKTLQPGIAATSPSPSAPETSDQSRSPVPTPSPVAHVTPTPQPPQAVNPTPIPSSYLRPTPVLPTPTPQPTPAPTPDPTPQPTLPSTAIITYQVVPNEQPHALSLRVGQRVVFDLSQIQAEHTMVYSFFDRRVYTELQAAQYTEGNPVYSDEELQAISSSDQAEIRFQFSPRCKPYQMCAQYIQEYAIPVTIVP